MKEIFDMKYQFPKIEHIDEVLPLIKGKTEFIVADRGQYKVVNYNVVTPDTFPSMKTSGGSAKMREERLREKAILRECRGLVFNADGTIMSRRLHKFFNAGERDETQIDQIDLSQNHVILEKLDGSMITPLFFGDIVRWGTKMGITETAMNAEEFVAKNPRYISFAKHAHIAGLTPIFEWCSRKNRIVIDYPTDRLVLLALRDTISGKYMAYNSMRIFAEVQNIDVIKMLDTPQINITDFIEYTKSVEGMEGFVVRFDDGHMVKIKGDWYLSIHKVKDNLTLEKNVIELIVNSKVDDAKAFMLLEDKERVEAFEKAFWYGFSGTVRTIEEKLGVYKRQCKGDKKRFALEVAPTLDGVTRKVIFSCWDNGKTVTDELLNHIRSRVGTQTQVESVRHLWGNQAWKY